MRNFTSGSITCCMCGEEMEECFHHNGGYYCSECFSEEVGCAPDEAKEFADENGVSVFTADEIAESNYAGHQDWQYDAHYDKY